MSKQIRCPNCGDKPYVQTITFDYLTAIFCWKCGSIPMSLKLSGDPDKPLKEAKMKKQTKPKTSQIAVRRQALRLTDLPLAMRRKLGYPD